MDASAPDDVVNDSAGALIVWLDGEEDAICTLVDLQGSSYYAEMVVLSLHWPDCYRPRLIDDDPVVICMDSQSAIASLQDGPAAQTNLLDISIWRLLSMLAEGSRQVNLQWVPSHSGIEVNES